MKKTKIICTLGPASDSEEVLTRMLENGMNVARLNFSHGNYEEQQARIDRVKAVREKLGRPVPILLDTKGPEFRIGMFKDNQIVLNAGDSFTFTSEDVPGDQSRVSVSYKGLPEELEVGSIILVNDGLVKFEVKEKSATELNCEVLIGGKLSNRKSMSFPGKVLKQKFLSDQDKSDLLFGIKNDVDFVAASFVSTAQDMIDMRSFLDENGGERIQIIAKIENQSGVDCAEEILNYCEGLMVARGDLGVEIPYAELPAIQKRLINLCRRKGGISVTATEMLESMINNPRPTRAEISDVANAVFDGSSVVMLSGESAMGNYPAEAVAAMAAIAEDAERNTDYEARFNGEYFMLSGPTDALSHSACQLAIDTGADCIVACTKTGSTGRMVSRFRAPTPIIGMTTSRKAYRQLDLSWNVFPVLVPEYSGSDELFGKALEVAESSGFAGKGDLVVVTGGLTAQPGESKLIYMDTVK